MAACLMACITHADINLNNDLLCLSLVLFPVPHPPPLHYTSLLTLVPAANLTHPVTLCQPVPAHLLYPWPCSSERPVRVQPLQLPPPPLHLSRELHTHPSVPHVTSSASLQTPHWTSICVHLWMCVSENVFARASMHARACLTVIVREGAAGDSAQPILRL